jgi:ribonucleoside-diphosphate reductase alpha chain
LGGNDNKKEWDSLEGIIRNTAYTVAKSAAYRQGLGVDFSRLRPAGMKVNNSSNISTGSTHWMQFIDNIGYYVGQYGRIPAMLFSLSCSHPDIEEFVKIKSDLHKIQNANISVQCSNDFYEAAIKDKDWELTFEIPEIKAAPEWDGHTAADVERIMHV